MTIQVRTTHKLYSFRYSYVISKIWLQASLILHEGFVLVFGLFFLSNFISILKKHSDSRHTPFKRCVLIEDYNCHRVLSSIIATQAGAKVCLGIVLIAKILFNVPEFRMLLLLFVALRRKCSFVNKYSLKKNEPNRRSAKQWHEFGWNKSVLYKFIDVIWKYNRLEFEKVFCILSSYVSSSSRYFLNVSVRI